MKMEQELKALLVGLDIQNIEEFMDNAETKDYLKLGRAYREAAMNLKTTELVL